MLYKHWGDRLSWKAGPFFLDQAQSAANQRCSARPKRIGIAKGRAPKNSNHTKGEIAALLTSGKVGSLGLILDDKDVVILLKAAVEQEGDNGRLATCAVPATVVCRRLESLLYNRHLGSLL